MILHAVSMVVFFVDQVTQAPVVVQYVVSPNADPGLKQWIQPILNLVSIVAVVGIAIWSFGATSRKEHRRWVLDQKKAEWKELLRKAAEIERVLPMVSMTPKERAVNISDGLKQAVRELSETTASCLFLLEFFRNSEKLTKFLTFIHAAYEAELSISSLRGIQGIDLTREEQGKIFLDMMDKTKEITDKYFDFIHWLRNEAAKDLKISEMNDPKARNSGVRWS